MWCKVREKEGRNQWNHPRHIIKLHLYYIGMFFTKRFIKCFTRLTNINYTRKWAFWKRIFYFFRLFFFKKKYWKLFKVISYYLCLRENKFKTLSFLIFDKQKIYFQIFFSKKSFFFHQKLAKKKSIFWLFFWSKQGTF